MLWVFPGHCPSQKRQGGGQDRTKLADGRGPGTGDLWHHDSPSGSGSRSLSQEVEGLGCLVREQAVADPAVGKRETEVETSQFSWGGSGSLNTASVRERGGRRAKVDGRWGSRLHTGQPPSGCRGGALQDESHGCSGCPFCRNAFKSFKGMCSLRDVSSHWLNIWILCPI